MELASIMKRLEESKSAAQAGVKTASVSGPNHTSPDALRSALRSALATTEKTAAAQPASGGSPVGELMKFAEEMSQAEDVALEKKAQILGAAMCDGFMERFASFEQAALQAAPPAVKTAAAHAAAQYMPQTVDTAVEMIKQASQDPDFVKFASENPDLVKEAYTLGYQRTYEGLVKQAQDDYERGYNETMGEVHKTASDCYKQGAITINNVLRKVAGSR